MATRPLVTAGVNRPTSGMSSLLLYSLMPVIFVCRRQHYGRDLRIKCRCQQRQDPAINEWHVIRFNLSRKAVSNWENVKRVKVAMYLLRCTMSDAVSAHLTCLDNLFTLLLAFNRVLIECLRSVMPSLWCQITKPCRMDE